MSSDNAIKTALVTKLAADGTLVGYLAAGTAGIYDSEAPENAVAPFVIFQYMANTPTYTLTQTAYENDVWMVKGITQGGSKALGGSISDRIYAALQDTALTVSGGSHLYTRRAAKVDYPETDRGVRYHHIGGTYRIWTT